MKAPRHLRMSPAMVVACLALLVALGGTSVAAVTLTIPRNSIGTLQLKENAVVSSKVKNGSLLKTDFRSGQLPAGKPGPAGPAGPPGPAGASGAAGVASPGYVAQVLSAHSSGGSTTSSGDFVDLADGVVNVTVPSGETDQLLVFFTAESACYGGTSLRACRGRILLDGNELNPTGTEILDSNALCTDGTTTCSAKIYKISNARVGVSMIRLSGNVSAGSHTVKVQYSTQASDTTFRLASWSLVVQRIKSS